MHTIIESNFHEKKLFIYIIIYQTMIEELVLLQPPNNNYLSDTEESSQSLFVKFIQKCN